MAGWHHWLNEHEFGWTPGVGDGQGCLACCNSWRHKESDITEQLMLFNLHYFRVSSYFWLLISSLIPWWCESRHRMISILLVLSRCVLWPRMWFILLNVPSELEKNVNSTVIVKVVYRCQLISSWFIVLSFTMSFLIFWFSACWMCSLLKSWVLTPSNMLEIHLFLLAILLFFCLMHFDFQLGTYILRIMSSWGLNLLSSSTLILITVHSLQFVWCEINTATIAFFALVWYIFLHFFVLNLYMSLK